MNGKYIKSDRSKRARIINFAWSLLSPYCNWAVTNEYVDFASFQQDSLHKVFQFCSALKIKFERSEQVVCFSKRYNFRIYLY